MNRVEIKKLLDLPLEELVRRADEIREKEIGDRLDLCNIMNAKSGMCGEDCKFCAQSNRHLTGIDTYPLKGKEEILEAAARAKLIGAHRFDIVTSGNRLTKDDLAGIIEAVREIRRKIGIEICASLGKLDEASLSALKEAGISRYHHNIETSPNFFSKIVTTHSFEERLDTIRLAKKVGMEVCSGGIIGMGESWDDRIDMVMILKELDVDSVPINILVPIKGTAFENIERLSPEDAIRTIAIFRIVLKDKIIKIAAGRESILKENELAAFMAGANGMLIGGYLTIKGKALKADHELIERIKKIWKRESSDPSRPGVMAR